MFHLGKNARNVALRSIKSRSYSEGFDISNYLNRIEAITKSKGPVTHKPKQQRKPTTSNQKSQPRAENTKPSSKFAGSRTKQPLNSSARSRPTGVRQPRSQSATKPFKSDSTGPAADLRAKSSATQESLRNNTITSSSTKEQETEWVSLDSFGDSASSASSRPMSKSGRRVSLRKAGSRSKTASGKKVSRNNAASSTKNQSSGVTREYMPCLSPKEALEVVLRNEGTSTGGFIDPIDVSLTNLQPNLVQSAVTYNSRVRSLLNSVSPEVLNDSEKLSKLVSDYVTGDFNNYILKLDQKTSLTLQSIASEVSANPTMSPVTKQFFAQVGSGKVSPKQIAERA